MIPAMALAYTLLFSLDAIYNWQFFTLLERAIRADFPQCDIVLLTYHLPTRMCGVRVWYSLHHPLM